MLDKKIILGLSMVLLMGIATAWTGYINQNTIDGLNTSEMYFYNYCWLLGNESGGVQIAPYIYYLDGNAITYYGCWDFDRDGERYRITNESVYNTEIDINLLVDYYRKHGWNRTKEAYDIYLISQINVTWNAVEHKIDYYQTKDYDYWEDWEGSPW